MAHEVSSHEASGDSLHLGSLGGALVGADELLLHFKQFVDRSDDVFWLADGGEHRILYVSPAYERIWGRSARDLYRNTQDWLEGIHPEDRERVRDAFDRMENTQRYDETYRVVRPDASMRWVRARGYVIFDAEGRAWRMAGTAEDVTSLHERDESLRRSEETNRRAALELRRLLRTVEESPVSVEMTDLEGTIEYVNPAFVQRTGYTAEEVIGLTPRVLRSGQHPPQFYQTLWDTIRGGRTWHGELCNRKKSGELFWESASIFPVHDQDGTTTDFVAVKEDITARKEAADELHRSYARLQELEQLRDNLVHMIVHDLRIPLQGMLWNMGFLKKHADELAPEEAARWLERSLQSTDRLAYMVNSLLDVHRLESGKMPLDLKPCPLSDLLAKARELIASDEENNRIVIECPHPEHTVECDTDLVCRVIANLVRNAFNVNPPDEPIRLQVAHNGDGVRIAVRDAGPGIPGDQQAIVFDKFAQLKDNRDGRAPHSSGLGLTFCKLATEAHGGTIGVDSTPGEGSTFWVLLPDGESGTSHQAD